MRLRYTFLLTGFAVSLSGCGGGGSSSAPVTVAPTINRIPVAAASASTSNVPESGSATLSASASSDPDGDGLTYQWAQTSGPTAEIVSPTSVETQVNFGETDLDETAVFQLTVSDGSLEDSQTVELVVQNTSDAPGADGVLSFKTQGSPVALLGNILSRPEDDSELLFLDVDESGATTTVHYEIEAAGDGSIAHGVPLRKTDGFQDFDPQVTFSRGYSGVDTTFFAVEPDRVLLMHDPDFDPEVEQANNDASKIYALGVELAGEDACLVTTQFFQNPYGRLAEVGYVLVGYRSGGLTLFSWPYDQPGNILETRLDQTKSYCGLLTGRPSGRVSTGTSVESGFLDVEALMLDYYSIWTPTQDRMNGTTEPPASVSYTRSVDLSTVGLDANASYVQSLGDFHVYTRDEAGTSHQILFLNPQNVFGENIFVVDFEGSLPTGAALVFNEMGSPFFDGALAATRFIILMQPDMNRVVKIPLEETPSNCSGCTSYVAQPPIYQDFSSGAATITRYESRFGFDRRLVFTHPDENRISVYPWAAP